MKTVIRWLPANAKRVLSVLFFFTLAGMVHACSDATGPGTAQIKIQLTDAAADALSSAVVSISRVYLQPCAEEEEEGDGGGEACEAADLLSASSVQEPVELDLLHLQNGVTADLTAFESVTATTYHQLRLVVDEATVTLTEEYEFEDGGQVLLLKVPSGYTSGIKVQLDEPIDLQNGDLATILVDFDLEENFVLQGLNQDTGVLKGVIFTPTLKEKGRSQQPG
jgi:hypothetical protein